MTVGPLDTRQGLGSRFMSTDDAAADLAYSPYDPNYVDGATAAYWSPNSNACALVAAIAAVGFLNWALRTSPGHLDSSSSEPSLQSLRSSFGTS